jgi:hypothetical protein
MAEKLTGHTGTLFLTCDSGYKVKIPDDCEGVIYQFFHCDTYEEPVEVETEYKKDNNLSDEDLHECFFVEGESEPFFLHEFIRDNFRP